MKISRALGIAAAAAALCGCGPDPTMTMATPEPNVVPQAQPQRVQVERIGVLHDDLAYNARRGVYVVRDTKTGQEFIGISGVGIAEIGSHSSGKSSAADER